MSPDPVESLVGLEVAQARGRVEGRGMLFRVLSEDGESLMVTADYRTGRVGVHVQAGKVVSAEVG